MPCSTNALIPVSVSHHVCEVLALGCRSQQAFKHPDWNAEIAVQRTADEFDFKRSLFEANAEEIAG